MTIVNNSYEKYHLIRERGVDQVIKYV